MALDRRTAAIAVLTVLAAAAVGVAAGAVVSSGDDGTPVADVAATGISTAPATTTTAAPTPTGSPAPGGTTVPVYVLGETGTGPKLYREFRAVAGAADADRVRLAVTALGAPPADPDYRTPWAGVPVTGLTRAGTDVTVTFGTAPELRTGDAPLAVQQVVHTVTAADPAVRRVRVVAPRLPAALTATPQGRRAQLDVLAPVWLLSPADGGTSGRQVVLRGTASVFEAAVSIEVRSGAGVAARTTATATAGAPERGDWTATMTLPPGDYTIAAYEVSAKDGSRLAVDTKRVTVG